MNELILTNRPSCRNTNLLGVCPDPGDHHIDTMMGLTKLNILKRKNTHIPRRTMSQGERC